MIQFAMQSFVDDELLFVQSTFHVNPPVLPYLLPKSPVFSSNLQPSSPSKSHKSPLSSKGHGTTSITDSNHGQKSYLNITKQQLLNYLRQPSRGDAKETTTMDIHLCGNQLSTYTSRSNFLTPNSWRLFQYDLDFLTLKMTS